MRVYVVQYQCLPLGSDAWGPWVPFESSEGVARSYVERTLVRLREDTAGNPRVRYRLATRVLPEWEEAS